ncbi:hypothetical protein ACTJIJ_14920 [Niabella sp. 22666]|uniref:hypothetical protein n=1 Tax=Niabella sp. 22666 TaxID=3453954 RepID=UPI003F86E498
MNASEDGVLPPPSNLKILVHRFASAGAAPMFNVIKNSHPIQYATIKGFFDATTLGIGIYVSNTPPDITIGYAWSADKFATDQIKEVAYHEFAHASHYRKTDFQLWVDNINFVAHHGGYGNGTEAGFEKGSLIEMWGYFMGREYAHRRYGPNMHSNLNPPFPTGAAGFANSWYAWNENSNNISLFDWTHIASAFLHDIRYNNIYNQSNSLAENNVLIADSDSISGYSISTICNFFDGSTTSPTTLMDKLRNVLPSGITGNTTANYDILRNVY